jgi:hypothetical protein
MALHVKCLLQLRRLLACIEQYTDIHSQYRYMRSKYFLVPSWCNEQSTVVLM